jgi:hypothetical protein
VDSKDEVRFHCFGACNTEWDVIIKVNKCSFREAQDTFAEYMGITDFVPYRGIASTPEKKISRMSQLILLNSSKNILMTAAASGLVSLTSVLSVFIKESLFMHITTFISGYNGCVRNQAEVLA